MMAAGFLAMSKQSQVKRPVEDEPQVEPKEDGRSPNLNRVFDHAAQLII